MTHLIILRHHKSTSALLSEMLEKLGHKVSEVDSAEAASQAASSEMPAALMVDQQVSSFSLADAIDSLRSQANFQDIPIITVSASANSNDAIESIKRGVFDHLTKPLSISDLESVLQRAIVSTNRLQASNIEQASGRKLSAEPPALVFGFSPAIKHIEKQIGMAASCRSTVLITGATGTGKDTVARAIHQHSEDSAILTVIDCTAVPEDYESFESLSPSSSGTVILDEIGDLNAQTQAMLVRALKENESSKTSPRVIATTQSDLLLMVQEKRFREDLFYRLNVIPIAIPSLKDRGSDVLVLADIFLAQARPAAPKQLSNESAKLLLDHNWPGNVRELQNLIYHLNVAVRAAMIEPSDLQMLRKSSGTASGGDSETATLNYYDAMASLEKRLLEKALSQANGSRSEAARLLGINRQLLYAKLKSHGLMS